jgi:hypothetical protein
MRFNEGDGNHQTATFVVAASDSLHPGRADYVCDGTADEIDINGALGTGNREVVLMAGNYSVDRTNDYYAIGIPSHTTLTLEKGAIITLANAQDASIIANKDCRGAGNTDITIQGGILDGNKNNQTTFTPPGDDLPDKTNDGVYFQKCSDSKIEDVTIRNTRYHGIMLRDLCDNNIIEACRIYDFSIRDVVYSTTSGIVVFDHSDGNIVKNNDIYSTMAYADMALNQRGLYLSDYCLWNQITGNTIHGNFQGMSLWMNGCNYNKINGNILYANISTNINSVAHSGTEALYNEYNNNIIDGVSNGIELEYHDHAQINDNIIGGMTTEWAVGIKTISSEDICINDNIIETHNFKIIDLYSSTNVTVMGNRGNNKIRLYDGSDDVVIIGNDVTGMDIIGTDHIIRDNKGYVTENSGTATLLAAGTSINVPHGLAVTPAAGDIIVTPMEAWGNMTTYYIGNYGATNFTIYSPIAPGQDVDFAWKAIVL